MTAQEMTKVLGKEALIQLGEIKVRVKVLDVKSAYGKTRYQVEPIAGEGTQWVEFVKIVA